MSTIDKIIPVSIALSTTTALAEVKTRFFDFDPAILHDYNIWALLGALQGIINH